MLHVCCFQVRSVPVRKDDEVSVVRGTYKVSSLAALKSIMQLALYAAGLSEHCLLGQALRALVPLCQSLVNLESQLICHSDCFPLPQ